MDIFIVRFNRVYELNPNVSSFDRYIYKIIYSCYPVSFIQGIVVLLLFVFQGDRCRCEVIPGDVAPSDKCDQPCYGDNSQMCGGSGKIKSAYLVLP